MNCQLHVSLFTDGNITAFRQDTLDGGVFAGCSHNGFSVILMTTRL